MAIYSIRNERQFCERMQYDILFKWFLDLNTDDLAWDQSVLAKDRERLLEHEVSACWGRDQSLRVWSAGLDRSRSSSPARAIY